MSRVAKRWLHQRQPNTGPRGAVPTPTAYAAALQETVVIPTAFTEIADTLLTIPVETSTMLFMQAVVGGVVTGASNDVQPLVDVLVREYDSDGVLLGTVQVENARQQSPSITAGERCVVVANGIYTPSDPAAASIEVVARAAAPGTSGTWTLNPDVAVSGGAVLSVQEL